MKTKLLNNSLNPVSYKKLNRSWRYVATIVTALLLALGNVQAGNRYFSRVTGASNPKDGGGVIVNTSDTKSGTANTQVSGAVSTSTNQNQTFFAWADANPGYYWVSWSGTPKSSSTIINTLNSATML